MSHIPLLPSHRYGFMQECMRKYDRNLYLQFDQTFRQLPLATIIDGATLVVHAGIDDDLTVAKLDGVRRSLCTLMRRHVTSPPAVFLPPVHRCSDRSSR